MPLQTASFTTSFSEWQDAFDYWREVVDVDIVTAWRQQAKLIAERLIGGVGGAHGWNRATPPGTKAQGEGAEARDIRRAVFPLKSQGFYNVKLARKIQLAVTAGDVSALQEMVSDGLFGSAQVALKVLAAGNEYTAHQNSRASRGRVPKGSRKFATVGDTYLIQYIREAKHAVGQGKGGWASSLFALGGDCGDWIARHRKAGTFIDNLKPGQPQLNFVMINRSKWAEGGDEDRIIDTVMGDRAAAIELDIANRLERSFAAATKRGR